MTTLKPWLITLAVFLVLRYTGALGGITYVTQSALMKTGILNFKPEVMPDATAFDYDFELTDLKGNKVHFSEFKNKVVFLNMWATWCGPCRAEMPSIQKLYNSVDNDEVVFVMLSIDKKENQDKVVKYVADKEFTFPVYMPAGSVPGQLQVPTIPTTFVIGKDGKVKAKKVGTANYDTDKFREFLGELAGA